MRWLHSVFDVIVDGTALRWVDDGVFPVSVEVVLTDVDGKAHHIIEKEPVLLAIPIDRDVEFPISLGVHGTSLRADSQTGEVLLAYDVVTTEGLSTLIVDADDVHWM